MFLIYKITNPYTLLSYVGLTDNLKRRLRRHQFDNTVECQDFHVEVLFENIPSRAEANEMEKVFIDLHGTYENGYNKTRGGGFQTKVSEKSKQKNSESQKKRVQAGTHNWLGQGDVARERQNQRVADGTHPWIDPEWQRENQRKRVANGTHHWLTPGWQRRHTPVLDPEWQRENQRKRVANGTHHLLGSENNWRRKKRKKAEWMWVRSLAMCWYEMHDYVMKRRSEFYNKEIPDTSNGTQLDLDLDF